MLVEQPCYSEVFFCIPKPSLGVKTFAPLHSGLTIAELNICFRDTLLILAKNDAR